MRHPQPDPVRDGQESVWDYPRPPRAERVSSRVTIELGGAVIVDTTDVIRVLETSHPPNYYVLESAFADGALRPTSGSSVCEFKGRAAYFDVIGGDGTVRERAAWGYPDATGEYAELVGRVAVYPRGMDRCTVDGETVEPQPGGFYGGWVTSTVAGPFKGGPGSMGW